MIQLTHADSPDWIGNEYSTVCPFNSDQTRLLLVKRDHFVLTDLAGLKLTDLPIAAGQEPRWSRKDPNVFYYIADSRYGVSSALIQYNVVTSSRSAIAPFPNYKILSGKGESDICRDGDHFVLCGDNIDVFLYSLKHGREASYYQSAVFDSLKITPKAKILISDDSGIVVQPGHIQLTKTNGHAAVASYQGHDILLWCSSLDPVLDQNSVMLIDIDDPQKPPRPLLNLPWPYAFHISTCDTDFCLVSAYDVTNALPFQIWKVPYDGTIPTLKAQFASVYRDYTSQPKAALSHDGSMAVFSIDDGNEVNTWLIEVGSPAVQPVTPVEPNETWIDYSTYLDQEFIMRPQADGSIKIYQRKK